MNCNELECAWCNGNDFPDGTILPCGYLVGSEILHREDLFLDPRPYDETPEDFDDCVLPF